MALRATFTLIDSRTFTIAPGCLPLDTRRFTLIDAPELEILPKLFPDLKSIGRAGMTPPSCTLLEPLCFLVRFRLLPTLLPFAGVMHAAIGSPGARIAAACSVFSPGSDSKREQEGLRSAHGDDSIHSAMAPQRSSATSFEGPSDRRRARRHAGVKLATTNLQFASRHIFAVCEKNRPSRNRSIGGPRVGLRHAAADLQRLHGLDRHLLAEGRAKVERGKRSFPPGRRGSGFHGPADIAVTVDFCREEAAREVAAKLPAAPSPALRRKGGADGRFYVRAIRPGCVWPRVGCRNRPIAAPGAALVPVRS
jgi:hypothetical protein